ncbi:MAG: cytochrome B [Cyanobacteria bacterium K_DeepCast_35m_m2_023]|nr:cytochrome B [Cyanobacteria bacterium K_DeepCast_35m_m2_023]
MGRPYQPSLLRLLHAGTALMVVAAWISGLIVYVVNDGRLLPTGLSERFRLGNDWIDIHGSAGVILLPVAVLLTAYALTLGKARLRRAGNLLPLAALGLALVSGKLMNEHWLRDGVLDHPVYWLHLSAWVLMALSVGVHLLQALQRGGRPLLRSMFRIDLQKHDRPGQWPAQVWRCITTAGRR